MCLVFRNLNSRLKSWDALKQGVPRLFFLLCYYFATNRNYFISHRLIANYRFNDLGAVVQTVAPELFCGEIMGVRRLQ